MVTNQHLGLQSFLGINPAKIEITKDGNNTKYVGLCLPDCTGEDDKKWLIRRISTTNRVKNIEYPNGEKLFDKSWSERATYNYKHTPNWGENGIKKGLKTIITVMVLMSVFASCATQKRSNTTQTVVVTDSTEIAKKDSIIRALRIEIKEQKAVSAKEIETLKSQINAKISEEETNYTADGKVANVKKRTVDYSKNTESEKIKNLMQKIDYQQFVTDSLISVYTEREQNYNNQHYDYQQKTEKKTKNNWYLWFFAGIIFNILIKFILKYFINRFLPFLKKVR